MGNRIFVRFLIGVAWGWLLDSSICSALHVGVRFNRAGNFAVGSSLPQQDFNICLCKFYSLLLLCFVFLQANAGKLYVSCKQVVCLSLLFRLNTQQKNHAFRAVFVYINNLLQLLSLYSWNSRAAPIFWRGQCCPKILCSWRSRNSLRPAHSKQILENVSFPIACCRNRRIRKFGGYTTLAIENRSSSESSWGNLGFWKRRAAWAIAC